MRSPGRTRAILALVALTSSLLAAGVGTAASGTCAGTSAGGEWRSYGHDLSNTRTQPDEHKIGAATASSLAPAWVFSSAATGTSGSFDNTPTVADGCVFLDGGSAVYALNADTGALVWVSQLAAAAGSPVVQDGKVIVNVSGSPGGAAALDEQTGALLWQTMWGTDYPGADAGASPAVFNGMVLSTLSLAGAELSATRAARGQYALLDENTGAVLTKGYSIPDADFAAGAWGGGMWATPVVDTATGYAYEGTGNPYGIESKYTDALVKIDVDPSRATFGQIVGTYSGTPDTYVDLGPRPGCQTLTQSGLPNIATCEFDDLDFGASPQLFTDADGTTLVGDLQKSGYYHVANADTMAEAWSTMVGVPAQPEAIFTGPASTASFDGTQIVVASAFPGMLHALNRNSGSETWQSLPLADGPHYESVSTANGLAYTVDGSALLHITDTATGQDVVTRALAQDVGQPISNALGGDGVAIARNTVYVNIGGYMVAYR